MANETATNWRIAGEEIGSCNCAWGCPCQFNALPTNGSCEGLAGWRIQEGHFGDTILDGVKFAVLYWWSAALHEGNGTKQLIIDEGATPDQRAALESLESGTQGGTYFEIFSAVCSNVLETLSAPITIEIDRERRKALLRIPDIGEGHIEPIKNPVTGEEHRARIVLPGGFEFKEAEMGNSVSLRVQSDAPLSFEHSDTYGQLNEFEWSNA